ncbi:hypothetical protein [Dyadobacter sp. 32]|uniref:hypothetical protein n=1 Tax=Dyadobacter sp. 32 TaxID=538966 RepID=UPI0011ECF747
MNNSSYLAYLIAETRSLIQEGKDFLLSQGRVLELSEWITIAEYSKKHNVSTQVISQWINRGVIPDHSFIHVPELGKKLVRDILYKN